MEIIDCKSLKLFRKQSTMELFLIKLQLYKQQFYYNQNSPQVLFRYIPNNYILDSTKEVSPYGFGKRALNKT